MAVNWQKNVIPLPNEKKEKQRISVCQRMNHPRSLTPHCSDDSATCDSISTVAPAAAGDCKAESKHLLSSPRSSLECKMKESGLL